MSILKILFIIALLGTGTCNIYNWIIKTSIPANIKYVEYTADQKYLGIITNNSIQLYEGVTIFFRARLYPLGYRITSFTFAQDSSKYAVGLRNDDNKTTTFAIFNTTIVPNHQQEHKVVLDKNLNLAETDQIISMCFTADNTRLIYGTSKGKIYIYKYNDGSQQQVVFSTDLPVLSLACSSFSSLEFVAAGSALAKPTLMALFQIDPITNKPSLSKIFTDINLDEEITDMSYSFEGNFLYRSGTNGIYKTDMRTYQHSTLIFPAGWKNFQRIRVTKKQDVYVASTTDNKFCINKMKSGAFANEQQIQIGASSAFGLAPHGATIFYLQNIQMGTLLSQCKSNQYLNEANDSCILCNTNCAMCLDQATLCHSCKQSYYVTSNYQCLSCIPRCKECYNGNSCNICYDPFIRTQNKLCGCPSGKFIDGNVCSNCVDFCQTCSNKNICQTCVDTFHLDNNNLCICPIGKFINDTSCISCAEQCLECIDLNNCKICSQGFSLQNGICSNKFPVWAIVLIATLCFIVLVGLIGMISINIAFLYMRTRKHKKSILLSTDQELASADD